MSSGGRVPKGGKRGNQFDQQSKIHTSARWLDWMRSRAGQLNREEDKRRKGEILEERRSARALQQIRGGKIHCPFHTVHIAFIYMLLLVICQNRLCNDWRRRRKTEYDWATT